MMDGYYPSAARRYLLWVPALDSLGHGATPEQLALAEIIAETTLRLTPLRHMWLAAELSPDAEPALRDKEAKLAEWAALLGIKLPTHRARWTTRRGWQHQEQQGAD